jgi:hypothetical protein
MKKNGMQTMMLMAALAAVVACGPAAFGQGNDAVLDLLVKKGIISQREANDVREQADAQMAQAVEVNSKVKVPSFLSSLEWSGDLRLRSELFMFEEEDSDFPGDNRVFAHTDDRLRFRYRARVGVVATLQDWAKVGVRLASGNDNDPVSTNQSFTDTFSKKPIWFDLAYVTLTPPSFDWFSVTGGKMNNVIWQPTFASPLEYDFDVNPEGLAQQINYKLGDKQQYTIFGNFAELILDEVGGDVHDVYMYELQAGMEAKLDRFKYKLAGGFYLTDHLNEMAQPGYVLGAQSASPNRGNYGIPLANAAQRQYLDEFQVAYGRAELSYLFREEKFLGTKQLFTLSGEYIRNISDRWEKDATIERDYYGFRIPDSDQVNGWTVQAQFGEAKKQGEWMLAYQYKYLEADATWDAITDSDWGNGGTDRRGHVWWFAYNVRDWWQLSFKALLTDKISDRPNSQNNTRGINDEDMLRVQIDSSFKF